MSLPDTPTVERIVNATLKKNGCTIWHHDDEFQRGDTIFHAPWNGLVFSDTKGKTQSTFWRIGATEEHGIDKNQFDYYCRYVEATNGLEHGTVVVYEVNREIAPYKIVPSNRVLVFRLEDKYRDNTTTAIYGRGGMVYWRRSDAFKEWKPAHD